MSDFAILTDSSADLGEALLRELEIQVLPLSFTLQGNTYYNYPDNRDMEPGRFYRLLRQGEAATTAAVNMDQYIQVLDPLLRAGRDVLILAFSSALSATHSAALMAAEELGERYPERKIYVVDTLCASLGQGLLVCLAAREREKGRSIQQVRDWAEENKLRICHEVTVDDLNTLKRGGRISATTAVVGSMLQIKPIICVNDEGRLASVGKARGRHAAMKALVDRMAERIPQTAPQTVFISHGDCLEDAQAVGRMVQERFGVAEVYYNFVGPVIGAHTGPGVIALCYLGARR